MQRIERNLREAENRLVYLASHPEVPEADRAELLPILEPLLATLNAWQLMKIRLNHGR